MSIFSARTRRLATLVGGAGFSLALCTPGYSLPAISAGHGPRDTLAEQVREGTARFRDINVAFQEGYVAATSCVSGPDTGAMGVHLVHVNNGKPDRVADGKLLPSEPEALIYEPLPNGSMRLVGVEFLEIAADWSSRNPAGPPSVAGNLMNLIGEPNRFGLPSFYELHVWAWEHNPKGVYADWNTQVSCENQAEQ